MDLCQFLATSIDNLVKKMRKSAVEKFVPMIKHFGRDDVYFKKGCYPYEYMTDEWKLEETELPFKSAFYNHLASKELDEEHYKHAKRLHAMTMLCDYLCRNVLLLDDMFQAFRRTIIAAHGLNCLHFPNMMLQLALKVTEVELELITDPNLMIESGIRGGFSYVAQHHALAIFPAMPDHHPDLQLVTATGWQLPLSH